MAGPAAPPAAERLEQLWPLSMALLPVWSRHLATSRRQAAQAVNDMLSAFAQLAPVVDRVLPPAGGAAKAGNDMRDVVASCQRLMEPVLHSGEPSAAHAGRAIMALLWDTVAQREQAAQAALPDAPALREKMDQMYVGFQYQDRINQTLTLLQEDMERLHALLASPGAHPSDLAVEPWMQRLESLYAMDEHRRDHHQQAHTGGAGKPDEAFFF